MGIHFLSHIMLRFFLETLKDFITPQLLSLGFEHTLYFHNYHEKNGLLISKNALTE